MALIGVKATSGIGTMPSRAYEPSEFELCMRDDLDDSIFNTSEFAITVSYTHKGRATTSYNGIWNDKYRAMSIGDVSTSDTLATFKMAEHNLLAEPRKGDVVIGKGKKHIVQYFEHSGSGTILFHLSEMSKYGN